MSYLQFHLHFFLIIEAEAIWRALAEIKEKSKKDCARLSAKVHCLIVVAGNIEMQRLNGAELIKATQRQIR